MRTAIGTKGVNTSAPFISELMFVQAMEPFFSVLLSALFLGERASAPVLLSLLPIVGGVAAASVSEVRMGTLLVIPPLFLNAQAPQGSILSASVYLNRQKEQLTRLHKLWKLQINKPNGTGAR